MGEKKKKTLSLASLRTWKKTKKQSYLPLVIAVFIMGMGSVYYDLATVMYIMILSSKSADFAITSYYK